MIKTDTTTDMILCPEKAPLKIQKSIENQGSFIDINTIITIHKKTLMAIANNIPIFVTLA